MEPSYIALHRSGELVRRAEAAVAALERCVLCPRSCGVNRIEDTRGYCRTGRLAGVASHDLHFGEESPISGSRGSGTIFFTHCNLSCAFCQNREVSHIHEFPEAEGHPVTARELAGMMLSLARRGAHNINLVSPSHVVPQILEALVIACEEGLNLPLVYNSGGYDAQETLRLLDGVVDIYMPDAKFWSSDAAKAYADAQDYPQRAREAIAEMHRQVDDLVVNDDGIAERGLLVRHLVLPEGLAGTKDWMVFLARLSLNTYVNVMAQYRTCGPAAKRRELARSPTGAEIAQAKRMAREAGLSRLDQREAELAKFLIDGLLGGA
ncbi:putative pyruvate formate lyase activating enzyme [Desulfobaculum xiamenense]|uniref:Putative pyruvate formate lyase activating enzyme n=1 Tax=Desulfobaculum xiamenense TaxID=995050 RepID=A0A846QP79_9BACT|nr:radical SAM protein [Desulfobaculum xiamenense]NJB68103.1 putative pyruvate formate lyase activating enzyme [Desulfobaculum xiamenense]